MLLKHLSQFCFIETGIPFMCYFNRNLNYVLLKQVSQVCVIETGISIIWSQHCETSISINRKSIMRQVNRYLNYVFIETGVSTMCYWIRYINSVLLKLASQSCVIETVISIMCYWKRYLNYDSLKKVILIIFYWKTGISILCYWNRLSQLCIIETGISIMFYWNRYLNHVILILIQVWNRYLNYVLMTQVSQ